MAIAWDRAAVIRTSIAEKIHAEGTAVGTTLKSTSPSIAEALGYTPLDFLFIDRQHGSPVYERLEEIVRAADVHDLPVLVRVPKDDLHLITYCLDIGVTGIMLPQTEDVDFVREAAEHVRYGDGRSLATTSRAAGFGSLDKDAYIDFVNEEVALIPQIESEAGAELVPELAEIEAVRSLAIGPGDLSYSMGVPAGSDEVLAVVDRLIDSATEHDCPIGSFVGTPEAIDRYAGRAAFLVYNSDVGLLTSHFNAVLGGE